MYQNMLFRVLLRILLHINVALIARMMMFTMIIQLPNMARARPGVGGNGSRRPDTLTITTHYEFQMVSLTSAVWALPAIREGRDENQQDQQREMNVLRWWCECRYVCVENLCARGTRMNGTGAVCAECDECPCVCYCGGGRG